MSFETRYAQLNSAQKRAVDTIDGPVMVVAGPGTGKTELLSVRIAHILAKTDTLPENILCLTFTDSGAIAMRERLVSIIGKDAYKVAIHTFHSFGSDIISRHREHFYRSAVFEPADELRQYEILRGIFEELEYSNPLASTMNGEFTHLADAKRSISELKRGSALTSDELRAVIEQSEASLDSIERILRPVFADRVGKGTGALLASAVAVIEQHAAELAPLYSVTPLANVILESLRDALEAVETEHPTKPISAWKTAWMERNDAKELVFKSRKRLVKMKAVAHVYYEYLSRMEKASLYDYDDMIMQVVHALEVNDDLRYTLQEQYLYLMVDEFQDTNLAQLRILRSLTDNPVNEGEPNILVVGDDDQAVYGFQGADISNILHFETQYPSRELVVLTDNYRSEAPILEASRRVIRQGTDRLETRIPELDKSLTPHQGGKTPIEIWEAPSIDAERHAIVTAIATAIQSGVAPQSIAVLARRHADIQSLLPYFSQAGVSVRYEREENILESPPIVALEQLAAVVTALADGKHDVVESRLPALLAHPAWGIAPADLWRLSLDAYENRQHWMEIMASTPAFTTIHAWLVDCAARCATEGLEPLIDRLIGRLDSEDDPVSPFYEYFFGNAVRSQQPANYLEYLSALRTIRSRLREHRAGEPLTLQSLVDFLATHRRLGVQIQSSQYSLARDVPAVQLLTAHKSKGLEFDHVYIFNAVDSVWGHTARSVSRAISYPENLPLAPTGNTADERLRLFYVAMTRAKHHLVMTYSQTNDTDKKTLLADFLVAIEPTVTTLADRTDAEAVETAEVAWYQPLVTPTESLHDLLAPRLEKFKLSATALNAFTDVTRGGPQEFLLNNLLHFPKAKTAAAAYGTAVHRTLQQAHTHVAATGEQKPIEDILHDFEIALTNERLEPLELSHYLHKGSVDIPSFIRSGLLPMTTQQKAEVGFSHQDVRINDARLTGSLDVMDVNEQERTVVVTDYKTGTPAQSWEKGSEYTKLKLHKYRQQLLFYKLLVEESSAYGKYSVQRGQLAFIEPTAAGESIVLDLELDPEEVTRTRQLISAVWKHIVELNLPDTSNYTPDLRGVLAFEQDLIDGNV